MKTTKTKSMYRRLVSILLIGAVLNLTVGCHFYRVTTYNGADVEYFDAIGQIVPEDYVIIHFGDDPITGIIFELGNITIDQKKNIISGEMRSIEAKHKYKGRPNPSKNFYRPSESSPTNEVHLHITEYEVNRDDNSLVKIDVSNVNKVEVYDLQAGLTVASYVLPIVGGAAAIGGIIAIIALLLKSSCPFVYVNNGEKYVFYGELYGGAISQNMERDDYMPLPNFNPNEGVYDLKITNELKERQYTDIAELLLVEHSKNMLVLLDKNGEVHGMPNLKTPNTATSDNGTNLLEFVQDNDSIFYSFMGCTTESEDYSAINLTFDKPAQVKTANLVLNVKNSIWLDYVVGAFFAQFGDKYEYWAKKQNKKDGAESYKWAREQGMMLSVEVKTSEGWQEIDHLNMVGPLAARTLVVPVTLDKVDGENLEVRLTSGYHFWELDYAAIDFSEEADLQIEKVVIDSAIDENGVNVADELRTVDGNYLSQLVIGSQAFLTYKALDIRKKSNVNSVFLHTRGYYEYIRDYSGKPNLSELKKFKNAGTFPHFAKERLNQILVTDL